MKHAAWILCGVLTWAVPAVESPAVAQDSFPSAPIRLVVGFAPGAIADAASRLLGQKLAGQMNAAVVVENRTGANGNIAAEYVARSKPNGYTLLFNTMTIVLGPAAGQRTGYDILKDLVPVARAVYAPNLIALHPAVPANSLAEFLGYVRASSGKVSYSSAGTGSPSHLGMVLLLQAYNLTAVHVPYKGAGPALLDVAGGHVQFTMAGLTGVLPLLKDKRVKVVAITSLQRSALLPDVPALAESMPGFEMVVWLGVMAPADTPPAVVRKLNLEFVKALQDTEIKSRLAQQGAEPSPSTPEEYGAYIRKELERWTGVFKSTGIKLDD